LSLSFVIDAWAACAPGVDTPQRWSQWAAAPWLPEGKPQVALAAVPPLLRRRFAPLGRLAAQAALDLGGEATLAGAADLDDNPTVYASRYGETGRCLELLADQACGNALSPTAFGLSVHNAIGAMIALTRGDRRNSSAIAAGRATAAAGVVEALALLDDGARSASLVVYDAPLPTSPGPGACAARARENARCTCAGRQRATPSRTRRRNFPRACRPCGSACPTRPR